MARFAQRLTQRLFVSMTALLILAAGAVVAVAGKHASAADFPARPVRLIVPLPPGGPIDLGARLIAAKLREVWRQPIIVENRPGGNSVIGIDYVAKSTPDGHTLLLNAGTLIVTPPHLQRTPYDILRDLVAVVQTVESNSVLAVGPKISVSSIGELVDLARKNPDRLTYGSAGNGSGAHLLTELLKNAAGISLTHIPYKGASPALQALLAGEVDVAFDASSSIIPLARAGKVRALLVTGAKPMEGLPNVPTLDSVYPGVDIQTWHGILAPASTPKPIVDQISSDVRAAVLSPDLSKRFREMGFEPSGILADRFGEIVRRDFERWGEVIRKSGIRAD